MSVISVCMMVHLKDACGMVSGAAHVTQHTIRPAFQIIKCLQSLFDVHG